MMLLVILTTFVLGFRAARQKRYAEHKDWMMWTVLLALSAGGSRIGMYAMQPFYHCDTFNSDWPFLISIVYTNTAAFICLRAVGRFGWQYNAMQ